MQNLILKTTLLTLASTQIAAAHPGHHHAMTPSTMVDHFLNSPFHVLPLVLAALVFGVIVHTVRKANDRSRTRSSGPETAQTTRSQVQQACQNRKDETW